MEKRKFELGSASILLALVFSLPGNRYRTKMENGKVEV
jgi:hypothetical protein